jgi:hypothetical protein
VGYAGRPDWQITQVQSNNPHVTAQVVPVSRNGGYIYYNLLVKLDKEAPAGYLSDHIVLVTNDTNLRQVPVAVEGLVQSGISVSPSSLFLGVVKPGEKVTKQLVVTGKKPFRILSITCDNKGFEFDTSKLNEARQVHVVPVTFAAGSEPGKISEQIRIETDLGSTTSLSSSAFAVVSNENK